MAGLGVALVFIVVGLVGTFWPRRGPSGDVLEIGLPFHFTVRSNVVGVGFVIFGIVMLGGCYLAASRATPRFPLSGRVALDNGRTISGISVGLIPPEHYAVTAANGTFRLELPKPNGKNGGAYQAIVYYRDQNRLRAEIATVVIDQNWVATIDHTFVG